MSQDYPPLALDDLVHLMSPSPAPQTLQDDSAPPQPAKMQSPSPEPLPEPDIIQMRSKVAEMHHGNSPDAQLTPRERELVEMVLRLTTVIRPDSEQLVRQADMISALIQQRDLLLHQAEEQRLLWNSEKDSWARMAEALLAQQAKSRLPSSEQDEDTERLHATEVDNKSLRQRLNETQSRLHVLESELTRLRPLLLMQPLLSRSSMPPPTPNPKTQYARRRKKDSAATEDEDHGPSEDDILVDPFDTPSRTSNSQPTPRAKSRRPEVPTSAQTVTNLHKRRPSQKATLRGISADARLEHLLLAARKIGKHRAGIMSGMVQHLEQRERIREDSTVTAVASTPKTPKRNMLHPGCSTEGGYIHLNGQMHPGPGIQPVPLFIPAYPHHILQTPSSSTTAPSVTSSAQQSAQKQKQDANTNNPPTPLDSLLNAARSMMREDVDVEDDEDEEVDIVGDSPGDNHTTGIHHARSRDLLGSPVPKRRKVVRTEKLPAVHKLASRTTDNMPVTSINSSGTTNAGAGRVWSGLDVLADQAAAFSTQEATPVQTQTQTKGRGKEKAVTREPSSSTPKSRGRTKSRRKEPEADAPSRTEPASRPRTPRPDLEDNPTDSAHTAHLQSGGSPSEVPVDPGGGTNGSTSVPSAHTLDSTSTNDDAQNPPSPDVSSPHVDDSADVTPRQGSHARATFGEEELDGPRAVIPQPNLMHLPAPTVSESENPEASSPPQHSETSPGGIGSGSTTSTAPPKNKGLVRVAEQDVSAPSPPAKRQRSPYVKWSKEEDELLAQAVAKYGQKWDLVQKALPSRGYHQVRQRWLRKLGVFDSKPDLSSFQTAVTTFPPTARDGSEPKGNPKLGLAPLSSERAFSGLAAGRPPSLPS